MSQTLAGSTPTRLEALDAGFALQQWLQYPAKPADNLVRFLRWAGVDIDPDPKRLATNKASEAIAKAVRQRLSQLSPGLKYVEQWLGLGTTAVFIAHQEGSGLQPGRHVYDEWYSEYEQELLDAMVPPGDIEAVIGFLRKIGPGESRYGSGDLLFKAKQRLRYAATVEDQRAASQSLFVRDSSVPVEIAESLRKFRRVYPDASRVAFIMMRFGNTPGHAKIVKAIRNALGERDLVGLRADDKEFHADLFSNVQTYIHGCSLGIAVFERLETEHFNPNVALEVGYMNALGKPICFLKDKTLATLPTDLVGKMYRDFDAQRPLQTIPDRVKRWLDDRDISKQTTAFGNDDPV